MTRRYFWRSAGITSDANVGLFKDCNKRALECLLATCNVRGSQVLISATYDVWLDAVFVDGDAESGTVGQLKFAVFELPSGVRSVLEEV